MIAFLAAGGVAVLLALATYCYGVRAGRRQVYGPIAAALVSIGETSRHLGALADDEPVPYWPADDPR